MHCIFIHNLRNNSGVTWNASLRRCSDLKIFHNFRQVRFLRIMTQICELNWNYSSDDYHQLRLEILRIKRNHRKGLIWRRHLYNWGGIDRGGKADSKLMIMHLSYNYSSSALIQFGFECSLGSERFALTFKNFRDIQLEMDLNIIIVANDSLQLWWKNNPFNLYLIQKPLSFYFMWLYIN